MALAIPFATLLGQGIPLGVAAWLYSQGKTTTNGASQMAASGVQLELNQALKAEYAAFAEADKAVVAAALKNEIDMWKNELPKAEDPTLGSRALGALGTVIAAPIALPVAGVAKLAAYLKTRSEAAAAAKAETKRLAAVKAAAEETARPLREAAERAELAAAIAASEAKTAEGKASTALAAQTKAAADAEREKSEAAKAEAAAKKAASEAAQAESEAAKAEAKRKKAEAELKAEEAEVANAEMKRAAAAAEKAAAEEAAEQAAKEAAAAKVAAAAAEEKSRKDNDLAAAAAAEEAAREAAEAEAEVAADNAAAESRAKAAAEREDERRAAAAVAEAQRAQYEGGLEEAEEKARKVRALAAAQLNGIPLPAMPDLNGDEVTSAKFTASLAANANARDKETATRVAEEAARAAWAATEQERARTTYRNRGHITGDGHRGTYDLLAEGPPIGDGSSKGDWVLSETKEEGSWIGNPTQRSYNEYKPKLDATSPASAAAPAAAPLAPAAPPPAFTFPLPPPSQLPPFNGPLPPPLQLPLSNPLPASSPPGASPTPPVAASAPTFAAAPPPLPPAPVKVPALNTLFPLRPSAFDEAEQMRAKYKGKSKKDLENMRALAEAQKIAAGSAEAKRTAEHEIANINKAIAAFHPSDGGKRRRKTPKRRRVHKARNSTFRRHRKH